MKQHVQIKKTYADADEEHLSFNINCVFFGLLCSKNCLFLLIHALITTTSERSVKSEDLQSCAKVNDPLKGLNQGSWTSSLVFWVEGDVSSKKVTMTRIAESLHLQKVNVPSFNPFFV